MKNKHPSAKTILLGALLLGVASAHAELILTLDGGSGEVVVADESALDTYAGDGVVTFIGAVESWFVNVTTGLSYPVIGTEEEPTLHLDSVNVSGGSGSLLITLVDTDYNLSGDNLFDYAFFDAGGVTDGSVTLQVYVDDANDANPFDGIEIYSGTLSGGAFSISDYSQLLPTISDSFSMGIVATITHTDGVQITSFDAEVRAVPEPSTVALLGLGLAGVGFLARKKMKA